MIQVRNLRYTYPTGVKALRNISMHVKKGEKVGIIGQNGAGKTTLVKHFNGLLKPKGGDVLINGVDTETKTIAQLSKTIGFIFQNPNDQIFNPTLKDEIAFGMKQLGLSKSVINDRIKEYLSMVGLWEERNKHPSELNYAERKFLSIVSILAMKPEIIIFDEPTTGQDYEGVKKIIEIIKSLKDETVIVVSHDMNVVAETCRRVLVMSNGLIISRGETLKVFQEKGILKKAFVEPPEIIKVCEVLGVKPTLSKKELLKSLYIE